MHGGGLAGSKARWIASWGPGHAFVVVATQGGGLDDGGVFGFQSDRIAVGRTDKAAIAIAAVLGSGSGTGVGLTEPGRVAESRSVDASFYVPFSGGLRDLFQLVGTERRYVATGEAAQAIDQVRPLRRWRGLGFGLRRRHGGTE